MSSSIQIPARLRSDSESSDVAAILGNSVKVCEKHYSAWVKSRRDRLTERVRATWKQEKPRLKVIQGGAR
jgi:hypothetical protein